MKWATRSLKGVRVHPPGTGIMHTINLERLATVVASEERDGVAGRFRIPLIGTDSHTPMINGIGVLGLGRRRARSRKCDVRHAGHAADSGCRSASASRARCARACLRRILRSRSPSGFGSVGLAGRICRVLRPRRLPLFPPASAPSSPTWHRNTARRPATFPIDEQTLEYLQATGRNADHIALVRAYARRQSLWFDPGRRAALHGRDRDRSGPDRVKPCRPAPPAGSAFA